MPSLVFAETYFLANFPKATPADAQAVRAYERTGRAAEAALSLALALELVFERERFFPVSFFFCHDFHLITRP